MWFAERFATARSAATIAPIGGRIAGRRAYGEFLMPSFHQPRPRPGFLIDTSGSMQDTQLARAVAELAGLTRQLGYNSEVIVACCDVVVHEVKKVFSSTQLELIGGGGTDVGAGIQWFIDRESGDRSARGGQRLPDAVAAGAAAVSGDHDSRRRRRTAAMGRGRRE